jgi:NADPH2:quinone reductase
MERRIMKAIQVKETGSYEVLRYVDVDTPTPGAGQVLIRAESISVNYADVMVRKGTYPVMPPLPAIPGMELSGHVEALGEGVTGVQPGQRVIVMGERCYAEYVVTDAASLIPCPDAVDMDAAAALPVNYLTAYHLLHTMGQVKPGQNVLAHAAAGGVGTALIQLAKLVGITLIGLTSTDEKASYAREQGIDHVINYSTEKVVERVREITGDRGVDLILNSVAGRTFRDDFAMLAPLGQIIWFGMAGGTPRVKFFEQFLTHFGKGVGLRVFHLFFSVALPYPKLMVSSIAAVVRHLEEKKIAPVIHERIPLREAARAHELLESRRVMGKLILKP